MPAEVVISAALVVLAIAISAELVAVCIVVGSAFVSITVALGGRSPQLIRMPARRRQRERREQPAVEQPAPERERPDSDLASDIMSNAAEGIVVYDREMRCQVWNHFMENLTGLRAEEVLGKRAADFFPAVGEVPIDEILNRVLKGETVQLAETPYMIPGTERQGWITASYRPQFDSKGNVSGAIGKILDLTDRKRTEQQMEYQSYHDALTGLAN